jgi:hypothetical protein
VVIWRAWVLFPEHQWIMAGPLFFLLATCGEAWVFAVLHSY